MPGGWLLSVHQGCHTQIGCHKLQKFFSESPGQQSKTEVSAGLGCLSLLRAGRSPSHCVTDGHGVRHVCYSVFSYKEGHQLYWIRAPTLRFHLKFDNVQSLY